MKDKYEQAIEREQTENDYAELFRRNRNSSLKTLICVSRNIIWNCSGPLYFLSANILRSGFSDRDRQYY